MKTLLDTGHVNKWLTLLANAGVLIGIILLALEVRQSNRIAIATTEISIRQQYNSLNEMILTNDSVAELLVKSTDSGAKFSAVEEEKLYAYFFTTLNTWLAIEIAYRHAMVPRQTLEGTLADVQELLQNSPALLRIAREVIDAYPSEKDSQVFTAIRRVLEESDP